MFIKNILEDLEFKIQELYWFSRWIIKLHISIAGFNQNKFQINFFLHGCYIS